MAQVLVIDDEKVIRNVIREILHTQGFEVIEASDGVLGLELFREHRPDLVITDIIMLEKSGYEVIWQLRKEFEDVKIIAISGGSIANKSVVLDSAKKRGADLCIEKPFGVDELLKAVEELLENQDQIEIESLPINK